MKIYVIATEEGMDTAALLLRKSKNASIITSHPELHTRVWLQVNTVQNIETADAILAVIDNNFTASRYCLFELNKAIQYMNEQNSNLSIIPVLVDNAEIPAILHGMMYLKLERDSSESLKTTQAKISSILNRDQYIADSKKFRTQKHQRFFIIALSLFLVVISSSLMILSVALSHIGGNTSWLNQENTIVVLITLLTTVTTTTIIITTYIYEMQRKRSADNSNAMESYSQKLYKAMVSDDVIEKHSGTQGSDKAAPADALGRMLINLEDIKEFYTWSQTQARASFYLAVASCIAGFLLFLAAIILPLIFKLSFEMTLVPAIGGIITELIAGTALVVYRHSILQLNHYHRALHEDERFLSSVNLLSNFSTIEARDEMLKKIIEFEMQMSLTDMCGIDQDKSKVQKQTPTSTPKN